MQHPVGTTVATRASITKPEWEMLSLEANTIAKANIVPKAYRGKPAEIVAAALIGRELGISPIMSLQYIHVIEGKPSVSAVLMVALIRRGGHSLSADITADGVTVKGTRADNGDTATFAFTRKDAQAAGLLNRDNWRKYFRSMAWARAVSQLARVLFPDVIMGVSYVPEELGANVTEQGEPIDAQVVTFAKPAPKPAKKQPKKQRKAAPVEPAEETVDAVGVELLPDHDSPEVDPGTHAALNTAAHAAAAADDVEPTPDRVDAIAAALIQANYAPDEKTARSMVAEQITAKGSAATNAWADNQISALMDVAESAGA